jgi:hypothetical protein
MIVRPRHLWSVFSLSLLVVLTGCAEPAEQAKDANQTPPATQASDTPTAPPQPPASADVLTLGAAKIMRAGHEDRAFELGADGIVTLAGAPFGTISSDGRMLGPAGNLMMTVQADGTVISGDGPTGIVLDDTGGSLTLPNKLSVKVEFGSDGVIQTQTSGPNAALLGADPPALLSQGCTGAVTRTCALITLSYLMALGNPDSVQADEAP